MTDPAPTHAGAHALPAEVAGRFVGQAITRKEDPRLLTGRGSYVDDVTVPGMLHACFVRSDLAHAVVRTVDVESARRLPGVEAVFTNAELAEILAGPMLPSMHLDATQAFERRPLADGAVRFVGEPIALVVATSRYAAEDAAELVEVDYDPLRAVVDFERAAECPDLAHPELGTNIAATSRVDDPALDAVLRDAAHVVTETFVQQRQTNVPMETRGIVARWTTPERRLEVWVSSQNPHEVRRVCAGILGIPEHAVRVVQSDVGGGFGQKFLLGREEMVVVLAAARLGRPVKWIEDRRENLIASTHARADRVTCTMALDGQGRILGIGLDHLEDVGAVPVGGSGGGGAVVTRFTGPYKVPHLSWTTTSVWTNTCARGAYRGPWMMETVAREQMMDCVAHAIGMDPVELRRRNVIGPDDQPYQAPSGIVIDRVSPGATLEQAVALVDYEGFRREQARARREGRYLGIGFSLFVEPQGSPPRLRAESATIRLGTDGTVAVYLGSGSHGQGIETTMAQVAADGLGVHIDDVRVYQGDTDSTPVGGGTGGSRTAAILAPAVAEAAGELRARVLRIAAHLLEAAEEDMELSDGRAFVRGTPARSLALREVAGRFYAGAVTLPAGAPAALETAARFSVAGPVWSNACHACICEVHPETGLVTVLRYVVSEDCGRMINPMIVEGQVSGGVAQGVGGTLLEHVVYDEQGTPLTTTFLDYLVPTASTLPTLEFGHIETPAAAPGGYKGMGEGGAIGSPPCVANAVADALAPLGVRPTRLPLTPAVVADLVAHARGVDEGAPAR